MLLGVVSDTHGHRLNTLDALRMLEPHNVDTILHCGDVGSCEIPPLFPKGDVHFVLGNVDRNSDELRASIEAAGHFYHARFGQLERGERRIAFLHGDETRRLQETIARDDCDLVCYGHTHRAEHHYDGRTLVLNPGAVYRAKPHSVALVDLNSMEVCQLNF